MILFIYLLIVFLFLYNKNITLTQFFLIIFSGSTDAGNFNLICIIIAIIFFLISINMIVKKIKLFIDMELMVLSRYKFNYKKYYFEIYIEIIKKLILFIWLILIFSIIANICMNNKVLSIDFYAIINYAIFLFLMTLLLIIFNVIGIKLEIGISVETIMVLITYVTETALNIDIIRIFSYLISDFIFKIIIIAFLSVTLLFKKIHHKLLERRFL